MQELNSKHLELSADTHILNSEYPAIWTNGIPRNIMVQNYYNMYTKRDVRSILNIKDLCQFQTFIRLCAGRIDTEFNTNALSNEIGISTVTVNNWINVLSASYIIYLLPPYFDNIGKRLVKEPKIYFYDTGLAAFILGVEDENQLSSHPLQGSLFENMVINEAVKDYTNRGIMPQLYFYRDKNQHEIDLIVSKADNLEAFEIKSAKTFHSSFLFQLNYFQKLYPQKHKPPIKYILIYCLFNFAKSVQVHPSWSRLDSI